MKKIIFSTVFFFCSAFLCTAAMAGPLPGAIFTTLEDGSRVNANIYEYMEDVYLDGGPGPNAPQTAASLPDGDYYFMVTDPSGKTLLSTDPVKCRRFQVENGIITFVYSEGALTKIKGSYTTVDCTHNTGIDLDYNALTVQLMPYNDTPNRGGVYKVWITPVDKFVGDPEKIDSPFYFHGFIPAWSKTDNFKVKGKCDPPTIVINKYDDSNANGVIDAGELQIPWGVSIMDPLGVINFLYTPFYLMAYPAGKWYFNEETFSNWKATAAYVDGVKTPSPTSAELFSWGLCKESHTVDFLNVQLGRIGASKDYDSTPDGSSDNIPVTGFKFCLSGTAVNGEAVGPICLTTGTNGYVSFDDLLPGNYIVTEVLPAPLGDCQWVAGGAIAVDIALAEGAKKDLVFENHCLCQGVLAMHTKGFWQNQGCNIIRPSDLAYLNGLALYAGGNYATGGQDNCLGTACPAITTLPFDSSSELGCYIVASNGQDQKLQLAQQLAAFILNTINLNRGVDGMDAIIYVPGKGQMKVSEIIVAANTAWASGDTAFWQSTLDGFNNMTGGLPYQYVPDEPCAIQY